MVLVINSQILQLMVNNWGWSPRIMENGEWLIMMMVNDSQWWWLIMVLDPLELQLPILTEEPVHQVCTNLKQCKVFVRWNAPALRVLLHDLDLIALSEDLVFTGWESGAHLSPPIVTIRASSPTAMPTTATPRQVPTTKAITHLGLLGWWLMASWWLLVQLRIVHINQKKMKAHSAYYDQPTIWGKKLALSDQRQTSGNLPRLQEIEQNIIRNLQSDTPLILRSVVCLNRSSRRSPEFDAAIL